MNIEIWSDIQCPFCYIGKRKLEAALEQFPEREQVTIEWRSFQLDPDLQAAPGQDLYGYLAERKGISRQQSEHMHDNVTQMAREAGLEYRFDRAVVANSFDAHRLIHLAKQHGLGDAAEERIFRAYFTEGADIGSHTQLADLAVEIGLDRQEALKVLATGDFADAVQSEIDEAQRLGVRGVPFFVFNRQYAVSGAQPVEAFLQVLTSVNSKQ